MDKPASQFPLKYMRNSYEETWEKDNMDLTKIVQDGLTHPDNKNVHGFTNKEMALIALDKIREILLK